MTLVHTTSGVRDVSPEEAAEAAFGELAEAVLSAPLWASMEANGTLVSFVADLCEAGYNPDELTGAAATVYDQLLDQTDLTTAHDSEQEGAAMTMHPDEARRAAEWLRRATPAQKRAVIPAWRQEAGGEAAMRREMAMVGAAHHARQEAEYQAILHMSGRHHPSQRYNPGVFGPHY